MGLRDEIDTASTTAIWTDWKPRKAGSVPHSQDVGLTTGDAIVIEGVWLYADLRDSSGLAHRFPREVAATCIGSYLRCTSHIIRHHGGEIRSFDGDRVMAIFQTVNTAVRCAQQIVGAVETMLRPKVELRFPSLKNSPGGWYMDAGVGVDWGGALMIRGGVRGNNDLASVGTAPNVAAKLSEMKSGGKSIFITAIAHTVLEAPQRYAGDGSDMWQQVGLLDVGGQNVSVYGSGWYKRLP